MNFSSGAKHEPPRRKAWKWKHLCECWWHGPFEIADYMVEFEVEDDWIAGTTRFTGRERVVGGAR